MLLLLLLCCVGFYTNPFDGALPLALSPISPSLSASLSLHLHLGFHVVRVLVCATPFAPTPIRLSCTTVDIVKLFYVHLVRAILRVYAVNGVKETLWLVSSSSESEMDKG